MELLVSILHDGHCHPSRYIDTFSNGKTNEQRLEALELHYLRHPSEYIFEGSSPCHRIERFNRKLTGGNWRQHQMELLVSILHDGHRHVSRHKDALSLQSGSGIGDQFCLEGMVTPRLSDDLGEFWII